MNFKITEAPPADEIRASLEVDSDGDLQLLLNGKSFLWVTQEGRVTFASYDSLDPEIARKFTISSGQVCVGGNIPAR